MARSGWQTILIVSSSSPTPDYRAALLAAPMGRFRLFSVAITIVLCALDGFDVFAITFVAPVLARDWGVGKAALGAVFSAGLIGMAAGSLFLAPAADVYGRRRLVIASLAVMVVGTAWSATADGVRMLAASRLITGLGIGAMIAVINPLAAEYSNAKARDLSVTFLNLGFPAGGIVGGVAAAWLLPHYGWQAIFVVASAFGLAMLLIVALWLPEPPSGLVRLSDKHDLTGLNSYLARCGCVPLDRFPQVPNVQQGPIATVFRGEGLASTIRTTFVYFMLVLSIFFIQSWMPSLVAGWGYSLSQSALVSVAMNAAGIAGGLLIAWTATRIGLRKTVVLAITAAALAIAAFGMVNPALPIILLMAIIVGFFTIGGMASFYAVVSRSFPEAARASGTGFVIGVGRLGSALGPWLGGLLFAAGFASWQVCAALAVPALIAAVFLSRLRLATRM